MKVHAFHDPSAGGGALPLEAQRNLLSPSLFGVLANRYPGRTCLRTCCAEAIRLARLLADLLPEPEVHGLLALMLLHDSRRFTRTTHSGEPILLDEQDRACWDHDQIREGLSLTEQALGSRRFGPYTIQAAIAAIHAEAATSATTDWRHTVGLYDVLLRVQPSPVVALNRVVAVAMSEGELRGLELIDALLASGELSTYYLAHSARAALLRRLGRREEAITAYTEARELTRRAPQQRFFDRCVAELREPPEGSA